MSEAESKKANGGMPGKYIALQGKGKQLEAHVHTALPPLVSGAPRGHVRVSLDGGIDWEYSIGPPAPKLCVRLKWWGESSSGTIFRVPVHSRTSNKKNLGDCTTLAFYQIRSALPQFKAYLQDLGSLTLHVGLGHMTDESLVIGQVALPRLTDLSPTTPLTLYLPVVNPKGLQLGKLNIKISIELEQQKSLVTRNPKRTQAKKLTNVGAAPAEFIVGPGAGKLLTNSSPQEDLDTAVSGLLTNNQVQENNRLDVQASSDHHSDKQTSTAYPVHSTSSNGLTDCGSDQMSMNGLFVGPEQLGVISELIDRGKKLRDEMVHSLTDGLPRYQSNEEEPKHDSTSLRPLLLAEIAQKHGKSTQLASLTYPEHADNLHELICLGISSDEDDSDGIVLGLDDISVTETDYPLHDKDLLSKLLYGGDREVDPVGDMDKDRNITASDGVNELGVDTQATPKPTVRDTNSKHNPLSDGVVLQSRHERESSHPTPPGAHPLQTQAPNTEVLPATKLTSKLSTMKKNGSGTDLNSGDDNGSSLTTLSSYLSLGERSLESVIVRSLGVERLTRLGRVTRARVCIDTLEVDCALVDKVVDQRQTKRTGSRHKSQIPLSRGFTGSLTYFVEYQFPAALNGVSTNHSCTRFPASHEVMRVASKKMVDGAVTFNHQSVFPVSFNSTVIQRWWNSTLIFRVYCRRPSERMPFLAGKAVVPLRVCLCSPSLHLHSTVEVRSSTLMNAVKDHVTDKDPLIGQLQVSIQLVSTGRQQHTPVVDSAPQVSQTIPRDTEAWSQVRKDKVSAVHAIQTEDGGLCDIQQTVRLKEPKPLANTITNNPMALQLLLLIPEATGVSTSLPQVSSRVLSHEGRVQLPPKGVPNCYLVCRLFCANPHPRTTVQWASHDPQFGFKQIYPLYLTPALLDQVCNNFTVIEVWHRTPGPNTDDELVGLVKVSLHQFYLAYSGKQSVELCSEAKLPVVAIDSYCPIVNPFSGSGSGHLAVLLAMGTNDQVTTLQQQFACGSYSLQKPYPQTRNDQPFHPHNDCAHSQPVAKSDAEIDSSHSPSDCIHHVFEVTVDGVRDLSAFNNTVWGEADCFVQYHFPSLLPDDGEPDLETLSLQPYRTGTTLCVPNPSFSQTIHHTLTLLHTSSIQRELVRVCGQGHGGNGCGLSGGVSFELWRRFYYPNIRDQLIAKASIPLVKLCAMVSMKKGPGSNIQTFSLPLKLVSEASTEEGGILDVTVKYEALTNEPAKNGKEKDIVLEVDVDGNETPKEEMNVEGTGGSPDKDHHDDDDDGDDDDDDGSQTSFDGPENSQHADIQCPTVTTEALDCPPSHTSKDTNTQVEVPEDAFEARVVVHSALHIEYETVPRNVYVTLHPHRNADRVCTPAVSQDTKPVWDYHCLTHIPNMYLQPQCSGLEFQVWSQPPAPLPHTSETKAPLQDDVYIGCAFVDLSPLGFGLRQTSGWYNIVDFGGQTKGQLNVSVNPTHRISYPSRLLSYQLYTSTASLAGNSNVISFVGRQPHQSVVNEQGPALSIAEPSVSRTTSMLYQQLRDNIQELDTIHKSLQVKLGEIESTAPFSQSKIHSRIQGTHVQSTTEHSLRVCSDLHVSESGSTEERTLLDNAIPAGINDFHISPFTAPSQVPPGQVTNPSPEIEPLSMSTQPFPSPSDVSKELSTEVTHYESSDHQTEHSQSSQESMHREGSQSKDGLPLDSSQSLDKSEQEIEMHPEESLDVNNNSSYSLTDVSLTSEDTDSHQFPIVCVSDSDSEDDKDDGRLCGKTLNVIRCHQSVSSPPTTPHPRVDKHVVDTAQLEDVSPSDVEVPPLSSTSHVSSMPTPVAVSTHHTYTFVPTVTTTNDTISVSQASSNDVPHSSALSQLPQQSVSTAASLATRTVTTSSGRDHTAAACPPDSELHRVKPVYKGRNFQGSTYHRFHQLPNFFMPPEELEESMRRLRTSVLTRPPPRTRWQGTEKENRTASTDTRTQSEPKSTLQSGTRTLRTLQEAHKYLDSRKGQRSPVAILPQDISSIETQRIAKIFSSRPPNLTKSN